jgi:hypothetical protein
LRGDASTCHTLASIYLERGEYEAVALNAGVLVASVLDNRRELHGDLDPRPGGRDQDRPEVRVRGLQKSALLSWDAKIPQQAFFSGTSLFRMKKYQKYINLHYVLPYPSYRCIIYIYSCLL